MSILELALMGFIIGLTGALAPGPTLIATIRSALHVGWTGGPRVTLGHVIAEMVIVVLIAAGISSFPDTLHPAIAGIGGSALILFGGMTLFGARKAAISSDISMESSSGPVLAGLLTRVSNPYFWIWWFSVGSALLISSLSQGPPDLQHSSPVTGQQIWVVHPGIMSAFTTVGYAKQSDVSGDSCALWGLLVLFGIWFLIQAFPAHPSKSGSNHISYLLVRVICHIPE
jgi:threonine/homoserine/homoserine lactone efflux protein